MEANPFKVNAIPSGQHADFYANLTQLAIILALFRAASFALEDETSSLENYLAFIDYIYYAPTFALGPILPYDAYRASERRIGSFTMSALFAGLK